MPFEEILLSDEMLQLANGDDGERAEATSIGKVDNGDEVVVRTMEVPKWLSNTDVTSKSRWWHPLVSLLWIVEVLFFL